MVFKKQLSNTKKLAINSAIDCMNSGKIKEALKTIQNNFSKSSDIYLFFKGWEAQLQNNHVKAIKLFEQSLLKNPLREDTLIGLAASYSELGDYTRARECAEQAIMLNSNSTQSLLALGTIISKSEPKNVAVQECAMEYLTKAFDICIAEQPDNSAILVDIMSGIGACYLNQKLNEQAKQVLETAVCIDKFNVIAHKNLASVYANLRMIPQAIESVKIAQMTEDVEDKIDAIYQEGMLQLMLGNYSKGWRLHEFRLHSNKYKHKDLFIGEMLNFKALTQHDSVLLFQEQGLGDFLQFSRYIPIISERCKNIDIVIFPNTYLPINDEVPSIKSFIQLNYGAYIRNIYIKSVDSIPQDYTYYASVMSLPHLLNTDIPSTLPFITDKVSDIVGDVAIFYAGSTHHSNDSNRSMPINYVKKLIEQNPEIVFVNMQLQNDLSEYSNVIHPDNAGLETMLAILKRCKLLISVDSMIVHLAGGANIRTAVLHAYSSDWRWGIDKQKSEWYPSIVNIRQPKIGDWDSVLNEVQLLVNSIKK